MKHTILALLLTAAVSAQSGRALPPDIDGRSYSRLPLIPKESLNPEGRRVFEAINGKDASVPRLGPPANSMYALAASEPYDRLNQLLRMNTVGARRAGVSDAVIDAIKHDRPVDRLPDKEATVIEFGRAMLRGNHQVPSALFAKMVRLFGREGTMEITMIMGDYTMTAMLLNAVDQHLPPDREPLLPQR